MVLRILVDFVAMQRFLWFWLISIALCKGFKDYGCWRCWWVGGGFAACVCLCVCLYVPVCVCLCVCSWVAGGLLVGGWWAGAGRPRRLEYGGDPGAYHL